MTLDTRHASREGKLPVAICFHQQGKKWYYHLDMKLTGDEFVNVCKATGRGRVPTNFVGDRPYDIKLKLEAEFDKKLFKNYPINLLSMILQKAS